MTTIFGNHGISLLVWRAQSYLEIGSSFGKHLREIGTVTKDEIARSKQMYTEITSYTYPEQKVSVKPTTRGDIDAFVLVSLLILLKRQRPENNH